MLFLLHARTMRNRGLTTTDISAFIKAHVTNGPSVSADSVGPCVPGADSDGRHICYVVLARVGRQQPTLSVDTVTQQPSNKHERKIEYNVFVRC